MIVLPGEILLAAFNAGKDDARTAQALHRVQAAVLRANGDEVPEGALPVELFARIDAFAGKGVSGVVAGGMLNVAEDTRVTREREQRLRRTK